MGLGKGPKQDDEGNNAFHIVADTEKMIHENLEWSIVMLKYPGSRCGGNNAFHIVVDTEKMIHENLEWSIVMLNYPGSRCG
nr:ankyrin repeat-containing protein [Tanacetum cinerariifolium]